MPFDLQLLAASESPEVVSLPLWKVALWIQLPVGFPPGTKTPSGAFPPQDKEQSYASPESVLPLPTLLLPV